jgi:large subunit ribosomal protein L25
MEQIQLTSQIRTGKGKEVARKMRRQGSIPAVLYGGELGNLSLSVDTHDFRQIVAKHYGESVLIRLTIEGDGDPKTTTALIKDFQLDPVARTLVHADFLEVSMGKPITVTVRLEFTGESPGVKAGGVMEFVTRELEVECLPSDMVEYIEVDISSLEIGDTLTVEKIDVGSNMRLLSDPEAVIATVAPPLTGEVEVEAPEEMEQAEPEVIQKGKKEEEE